MTSKHNRRHRKKSHSSTETTTGEVQDGKDVAVKEMKTTGSSSDAHVVPPAVVEETTKSTAAPGESIRGWFSSLSWEDQTAVCSVEDTAFVASLLDLLASLSPASDDVWNATFSLEQVKQVYNSNLLQNKSIMSLTEATMSEKMNKTASARKSTSVPPMESVQSIPEERDEVANEEGEEAPVDACSAPPAVDSDAFRIRNEGGASTTPAREMSTVKETMRKQEQNCGILRHLRIVYPSAYNLVHTHPAFQEFLHADNSASLEQSLKHPILTLDPLANCASDETLGNFDNLLKAAGLIEVFLSEERYNNYHDLSKASWIQLLEPLFEQQPDHSASLLVLLVVRMEHAAMTAHRELDGKQMAIVGRLISTVASNEEKCKGGKKNAIVQEQKETRVPLSLIVDAVKRYESQVVSTKREKAMEEVCSLIPKQLLKELSAKDASIVLIPFSSVLHHANTNSNENVSSYSALNSMNNGVEVAMKTLVDNDAAVIDSVETKNAGGDAKTAGLQQHGHTAAKKSKKKKKKKKRKSSNADQSTCSSDVVSESRSAATNGSCNESQKKNSEKLSETKSAGVPAAADGISVPSTKVPVAKQFPSKEAESVVSSQVKETPAPVPKSEDTERVVPVAAGGKDEATGAKSTSAATSEKEMTVAVVPSASVAPSVSVVKNEKNSADAHDSGDDHSAWETVEVKNKGNRNRRPCNGNGGRSAPGPLTTMGQGGTGKKKNQKSANSRRRNAQRKMAREIIASVLDGVDVEVKRRRSQVAMSMASRAKTPSRLPGQPAIGSSQVSAWQARPMTMRDVVLGRLRAEADLAAAKAKNPRPSKKERPVNNAKKDPPVNNAERTRKNTPTNGDTTKASVLRNNGKGAWVADQSTAPTVPETLSGISAATQTSGITDGDVASASENASIEKGMDRNATVDYASSGDIAVSTSTQQNVGAEKKETSPTPPLQTLPWPATANSATSSVASSLEVPNGRHLHHRHSSVPNENDVGYHLLDVCDRLSRDMDVFMGRRAVALIARRQERGALLAALQDTASKLWANQCHVEMYGSCATQLDLPSSDLDAVICGLDRRLEVPIDFPLVSQQSDGQMSSAHASFSQDDVSVAHSLASHESQPDLASYPYSPTSAQYMNVPALSPSAERVIRLAAELERQPWAVQVKAIPTATVPVVKILADPSRLPGAVASVMNGGDWMMQQHHMAAQAAAIGMSHAPAIPGNQHKQTPPVGHYAAPNKAPGAHAHFAHHSPPPWRGADVMNGLFSVDITFEGPEHGGIGSTQYSARFVQDACNEVGLPPDRAPVVQALMVLKELLAQRRLNEPFSGGLSSYALLLLVDAVLKERKAIKHEMEKIERQRQVVASGDSKVTSSKHSGGSKRKTAKMKKTDTSIPSNEPSIKNDKDQKPVQPSVSGPSPQPGNQVQRGTSASQKSNGKSSENAPKQQIVVRTKEAKDAKVKKVEPQAPRGGSSWACIAKKNTVSTPDAKTASQEYKKMAPPSDAKTTKKPEPPTKKGSFADAVSNRCKATENFITTCKSQRDENKKQYPQQQARKIVDSSADNLDPKNTASPDVEKAESATVEAESSNGSNDSSESGFGASSLFPQGSNDVLEVLCSGETTAGKLLLHFLLFYGRHFESHTTAVDLSGKHHPDAHRVGKRGHHHIHLSPYVPRTGGGSIDPVTGMLTVDPIVVYDPLEGAEDNNVARSCFAWSSIRWVFAQSYMTLSSAVERSGTPPTTPGDGDSGNNNREAKNTSTAARVDHGVSVEESREATTVENNMVSPLLELLLSF